MEKTTFVKEHAIFLISAFVIVAGFSMIAFIPALSQADKNQINMMQIMVLGYYVGASKGSAKKDEIIIDQLAKSDNKE